MLSEKQIVSELIDIQKVIAKDYICGELSLREALDNLRIMIQYVALDNESLQRELESAKRKK